ncbi:MAG TPA: STAS domain-containing protein [Terrimicrobiaceae bacterium]|nr:STAS domain-containing protein [Terrimicrobiaceae bacterium]
MKLQVLESSDTLTHVALEGSLDIAGVQAIEAAFLAQTAGRKKPVLIDLAGVSYMASFGMRMIIDTFKVLDREGRKMALLHPQPMVAKILESAGMSEIVLITHDEAEARKVLES